MKPDPSFSLLELKILIHYHDPNSTGYGNGVEAAALAGSTGNRHSRAVLACRTRRKARESGPLASALRAHGCTLDEVAQCLSRCLTAQRKRAFMTKHGEIVYADLGDDYQVQLTAAKLLLPLLGAFDSKRQEEEMLANVADAMDPAEQEELAKNVDEEEAIGEGTAPDNQPECHRDSLKPQEGDGCTACSQHGSADTAPANATGGDKPLGVVDVRATLLREFAATARDLQRARAAGPAGRADRSKRTQDLCRLAQTVNTVDPAKVNSELMDHFDEIRFDEDEEEVVEGELVVNGEPKLLAAASEGREAAAPAAGAGTESAAPPKKKPRDPKMAALQEGFERMSEADRFLARQEVGLLRRALRLRAQAAREDAEKAAREAEKAQKPPEEPPKEPQS